MTFPMDHDTCSQLLRAYVTGEAGEDAPAIARHLQDCRQCQVERAGLEMLLAPVDPLTEAERAHLHAGVAAGIRPPITVPSRLAPVPAPGGPASRRPPGREVRPSGPVDLVSRRLRRFAPALSAAAAILLVLSGVILFQHVGTSQNSPSAASAKGQVNGAQPARSGPGEKTGGLGSLPLPAFRAGQLADIDQVQKQAAPLATAFARAYSGAQVEQLAPGFLRRLVHLAPLQHRTQLRQCGDHFLKTSGGTAIPLLGSRTTLDKAPVLALAFASSSSPGGPLTRLIVVAWPLGSCSHPVTERGAAVAR
ncbi:MAG: hypothetical protein M3P01_05690 [Actinomycetota bacterium]|nr:hypothetical protein [Actinomycetota bacterium]